MDSIFLSTERTRNYRASRTEEDKKKQREFDRLRIAKKRAEEKQRKKIDEQGKIMFVNKYIHFVLI